VRFIDPKGLYLPGYHYEFTKNGAFSAGLNLKDALSLAQQVVDVDNGDIWPGSQKVYNSHMHAMCAAGLSKDICMKNYYNWLNKQYNKCTTRGLAAVLHAWQDSFAGGHENMTEYNGFLSLFLKPSHFLNDLFPSFEELRLVPQATAGIIKMWKKKCECQN